MRSTKILVLGALLAVLSAMLQIVPAIFSEGLAGVTVLSAFPIYIVSRIRPKTGILAFITAFVITSLFSVHEAMFLLFTNGTVGLSLGSLQYYHGMKMTVPLFSALVLVCTLSIMNFIIGIPVLGTYVPEPAAMKIGILLAFSLIYCTLYFYVSNLISYLLTKNFKDIFKR